MAIILLAFSGIVGTVAMPTLAAVLIVAAIGSLRTGQVRAIMRTSRASQIAVIATFVATLLLPVAAAVGLGVIFALLMQLNREALDLRIVELVPTDTGSFVEKPAPQALESRRVVLLDIYGSLVRRGRPHAPGSSAGSSGCGGSGGGAAAARPRACWEPRRTPCCRTTQPGSLPSAAGST